MSSVQNRHNSAYNRQPHNGPTKTTPSAADHKHDDNEDASLWKELNADQIDTLHSHVKKVALPILLGTDAHINKWELNSGKNLESGLLYTCNIPECGTVWKIDFILDCPADIFFNAISVNLDISWIPNLAYSKVLKKYDQCIVLQQRIHGVTAVSDRDFIIMQFAGKITQKKGSNDIPTYYALTGSVPDGYYNTAKKSDCVRGEYLPSGWSFTPYEENGKMKCVSTMIYNVDLKGFLPKRVVSWAAAAFLTRHVKAAQEHAQNVFAASDGTVIIEKAAPRTSSKKSVKKH